MRTREIRTRVHKIQAEIDTLFGMTEGELQMRFNERSHGIKLSEKTKKQDYLRILIKGTVADGLDI